MIPPMPPGTSWAPPETGWQYHCTSRWALLSISSWLVGWFLWRCSSGAKLAQMVLPGGGVAAVTAVQCRCGGLPGNAVARHVAARAWRQIGAWLRDSLDNFDLTSRMIIFIVDSLVGVVLAADFAAIRALTGSWKIGCWLGRLTGSACGRLLAVLPRWRRRGCKMPKALAQRASGARVDHCQPPTLLLRNRVQQSPSPWHRRNRRRRKISRFPFSITTRQLPALAANLANGVAAIARAVVGQKAQTPDAERFANFELPPWRCSRIRSRFRTHDQDNAARTGRAPGKNVQGFRTERPRRRHQHRAGHHPVRSIALETGSGSTRSRAWPTIWP